MRSDWLDGLLCGWSVWSGLHYGAGGADEVSSSCCFSSNAILLWALYNSMKKWKEEICHKYQQYIFGYTTYIEFESGDALSEIYCKGFLPMSHNNKAQKQFYEARGLRIPLKDFTLTSENQRILRLQKQPLQRITTTATKFDFQNSIVNKNKIRLFHTPSFQHPSP